MTIPKKYLLNSEWLTIKEISEKSGLSVDTLRKRLKTMSPNDAIRQPARPTRIYYDVNGEKLTHGELAKRIGINSGALSKRLKTMTPEQAAAIPPGEGVGWTDEELAYLAEVYNTPNLYKHWAKAAKRNGWRKRSDRSMRSAIKRLQDDGIIGSRKVRTDEEGWIVFNDLANYLGVSHPTIRRWAEEYGMPAYKNGDGLKSQKKVHLKHFVDWAIGEGKDYIVNHLYGNRIGLQWFLGQISLWINEDAPKPLCMSIRDIRKRVVKKKINKTKKTIDTRLTAKL